MHKEDRGEKSSLQERGIRFGQVVQKTKKRLVNLGIPRKPLFLYTLKQNKTERLRGKCTGKQQTKKMEI